jgi:HAD superfamily hydrolase (TIGR01548 family)
MCLEKLRERFDGMFLYEEIEPKIFVKPDKLELISGIDSLILDIDGVILDVKESFRLSISRTVQFYFSKILNWTGSSILVTPEETQLFKRAGGFNNDWDLTFGVVLFYLYKANKSESFDLDFIRQNGESLESFTKRVSDLGGGLEAVEKIIFGATSPLNKGGHRGVKWGLSDKIEKLWQKDKIRKLFDEVYGGTDYCEKLYGHKPSYIFQKGLLNNEKILLKSELLKSFYPRIAIITGRAKVEAYLALERTGLKDLISDDRLIYDDGSLHKPDPKVLEILADRLEIETGMYIGDTYDDLLTVQRFRVKNDSIKFLSCIISCRENEDDFFKKKGTDILARDVNSVIEFVKREIRKT